MTGVGAFQYSIICRSLDRSLQTPGPVEMVMIRLSFRSRSRVDRIYWQIASSIKAKAGSLNLKSVACTFGKVELPFAKRERTQ